MILGFGVDNPLSVVIIIVAMLVGIVVLVNVMAIAGAEVVRFVYSSRGDRDEELMAQADDD